MYAQPSNTDIRLLIKDALARDWTVAGGGKRHYRLLCPNSCKCVHVLASSTANKLVAVRARTHLTNHTCWESAKCPPHQPPAPHPHP